MTNYYNEYDFNDAVKLVKDANLKIKDEEYNFNLNPNQNFYFVISQERGGEKQVVTSCRR